MKILAIETSCDETAVAIYDGQQGLLANVLFSQATTHAKFGGVVPELASRDHIRKLIPLCRQALQQAACERHDIDAVAYTAGPGLIGALLVGAGFARSLAWAWGKPCVPVHHLKAHLLAPMLEPNPPAFPFIALLVSGGHTMLVQVDGLKAFTLLGDTLDDAVGEAFDKTAKLLGLGYPGGPLIEALAKQGNPEAYTFPRPMVQRPGLDFSFSGLKTFALRTWQQSSRGPQVKADIACAFQQAIVDTLVIKCQRALSETHLSRLVVAGGVAANEKLRAALCHLAKKHQFDIFFPRHEFCTDNAAMVAYAGYRMLAQGDQPEAADLAINAHARWSLQN